MYTVTFISKRSNVSLKSLRLDIPKQLASMFQPVVTFLNLKFPDKIKEGSESDKLLKQALSAIKHAAGHIIEGGKVRTICAPDDNLKRMQRQVLRSLQNLPMHTSAHGFIRGRDPLTCASAHTSYWGNKANDLVILNMDAKNFFPSITSQVVRKALEANRVRSADVEKVISSCMCRADETMAIAIIQGLVRLSGNNERVSSLAQAVAGVFTKGGGVTLPAGVSKRLAFAFCQNFLSLGSSVNMVNKFLPQGSPTSPMLSNIAFKIVDTRLAAMAASYGGFYTRYADDLTVTWQVPTKGKVIDSMYRCSELVLAEFGVAMNRAKKRVMGPGVRQDIVGLCINSGHPTISRKKRMRVRAMAHNEMVRGSKNFHAEDGRGPGKHEDYTQPRPGSRRVSYLMGTVGHIGSVHPQEGGRYFNMIRSVTNPTNVRPLIIHHHDEIFYEDEPRAASGSRVLLPEIHPE